MKKKGFTLVELLAVIVVLAIISSLAIVGVSHVIKTGKDSVYASNESTLKTSTQNYVLDNMVNVKNSILESDEYVVTFDDLVTGGYIDDKTFKEPANGTCNKSYVAVTKNDSTNADYDFNYDVCLMCFDSNNKKTYRSSNSNCLPPPATITCLNPEYNGQDQEIATCSGGTISDNTQKYVGDYEVYCEGDSDYSDNNTVCSIQKAHTTTSLDNISKTYDATSSFNSGATSKFSSGTINTGGSYSYTFYSDSSCRTKKGTIAPSSVGNYYIKATLNETDNYYSSSSECKKFDVNKSNTTTSLDSFSEVHYPNVKSASGATSRLSSGSEINGATYTYAYYSDGNCTTSKRSTAPTTAGNYYVKATLKETSNYNSSSSGCRKYFVYVYGASSKCGNGTPQYSAWGEYGSYSCYPSQPSNTDTRQYKCISAGNVCSSGTYRCQYRSRSVTGTKYPSCWHQ